jgi:hypothetical protein
MIRLSTSNKVGGLGKHRPNLHAGLSVLLLVLLQTMFAAFPAFGAEKTTDSVVNLVVENDHFNNTDRHYTNGINWGWAPPAGSAPEWIRAMAHLVPFFPEDGVFRHGYSLGQSTFTPSDLTLDDPPTDDRPYAGWLYGTIGMETATEQQLDQLVLTLGVVGPASLAEFSQKALHKARAVRKPRGWDTQLRNEPGIVITYQRHWRLLTSKTFAGSFDLTPHAGGAVGNIFTYANSGLTLRFGQNLPPDYGPPRIQPGIPGSMTFVAAEGFTWHLFAGVEGRVVARNIFLDGNTFRHSRSVDREIFVGDLQFGAVLTWQDIRLSYTHVLRTDEFKSQLERHDFGAVTLAVLY